MNSPYHAKDLYFCLMSLGLWEHGNLLGGTYTQDSIHLVNQKWKAQVSNPISV